MANDSKRKSKALELGGEFIEFLHQATAPFGTVITLETMLIENGFEELRTESIWKVGSKGRYYVKPFDTMLIAFTMPSDMHLMERFKIIGSHLDSPCFKIKPNPIMTNDHYVKLNVERYGSPILNTWLDRNISIAGSVVCASTDPFKPIKHHIDMKEHTIFIPNLAIHLNREVNSGFELNVQKHLLPVIGQVDSIDSLELEEVVAAHLGIEKESILDYDLNLYIKEPGEFVGLNQEFIKAPRIDNLAMVYNSMKALMEETSVKGVNLVACFDNEEIGSNTKQGADSTLLATIMERIFAAYDKTKEQYQRAIADSFFISADGATGIHPNFKEKQDPTNPCYPNEGIAIKVSSSKRYATDAETSAVIKQLSKEIGIKTQHFISRSDMVSGRTIGTMAESQIGVKGVDIGLPVLAMHSAHEYMGIYDFYDSYLLMKHFYQK